MKNRIMKPVKIIMIILYISVLVAEVNYSEHISPIIYNNCTECHRIGEIGSFLPLTNYFQVFEDQDLILDAISIPDPKNLYKEKTIGWQTDT